MQGLQYMLFYQTNPEWTDFNSSVFNLLQGAELSVDPIIHNCKGEGGEKQVKHKKEISLDKSYVYKL